MRSRKSRFTGRHTPRLPAGTPFHAGHPACLVERMPSRRSRKERLRRMTFAVAIALLSTAALVAVAARQSPATQRTASARPRASRAAINAAEERAIWAPRPDSQSGPPAVTVTGCLEKRGDGFRLKNANGDAAPKARSWKSAFFRKGPAPIDIVDAPRAANVASHVGEQVRVIGVLDDRDMRVRSLQRVASSCS